MTSLRVIAAATLSLLCIVDRAPASAQSANGGLASATVSAMSIGDGTSVSIAAGTGYRFNSMVTLGIELTFVPNVTPKLPEFPTPLGPFGFREDIRFIPFTGVAITFAPDGGHATIFTTNLRLTIPTRSRRVSPYLIGGAGTGTVKDIFQYTVTYPPLTLGPGGPVVVPALLPPVTRSIARTSTDFAATLGGGIGFLTTDQWSFDVDARYMVIFGPRNAHIGRYAGGITYRF